MEELIGLELNGSKGYFYVSVNGKQEGKMTFVFAGNDKIIIDHTEVNPGNNGKGFGKKNGCQGCRICPRKRHQDYSALSFCQKGVRQNPGIQGCFINLNSKIMNPNDLKKEYTNGEVTIVWQSGKCIHSANCVKNNPDVFRPKEQPWIKIDGSSTDKIIETVQKCPSGALTFYKNE